MNPFAFFEIEPSFLVDKQALRRLYLANQRKWHPDFHAGNPEMHRQALQQTAANNEAYSILSDDFSRVKSLLSLNQIDAEKEQVLPGDFLMEMMDLSDLIEEANAGNPTSMEQAQKELDRYNTAIETALSDLFQKADNLEFTAGYPKAILLEAAAIYQQNRYLGRLRKNLLGIKEL